MSRSPRPFLLPEPAQSSNRARRWGPLRGPSALSLFVINPQSLLPVQVRHRSEPTERTASHSVARLASRLWVVRCFVAVFGERPPASTAT
jgi:hypothetical protein